MTIDDRAAIPALVNYDAAVDWPARLEREGPFLLRVLADQGFEVVGIEGVRERWEVARLGRRPKCSISSATSGRWRPWCAAEQPFEQTRSEELVLVAK